VDIQVIIAVLTLLGVVVAVIALVPRWVAFLEERPHVARRFGRPLGWLRRWWRAVFALVVLAFVDYLVWRRRDLWLVGAIAWLAVVLLLFRREVGGGARWLVGLVKRFYLWTLWRLVVRPARDHLDVAVCEVRRESLQNLSIRALQMLGFVARSYLDGRTVDDGRVWVSASDCGQDWGDLFAGEQKRRMQGVFGELMKKGWLDRGTWSPEAEYDPDVLVRLPRCFTTGGAARTLQREVEQELSRKIEAEVEAGHWPPM
jgi:hypothetical protein